MFEFVICICKQPEEHSILWPIPCEHMMFNFQVLSKKRLHDLVEEVDPTQLIDEDVEEVSEAHSETKWSYKLSLLIIEQWMSIAQN